MASLAKFQIFFDNPHATYYSGQNVTGRVVVKLNKEKKIRGIELRFKGEAEVKWTESRTVRRDGKSETVHDHYHKREAYFESFIYVVGGPNQEMILPVGEYVYPFNFLLPYTVPSSFEGKYGHVRYTLKAKMNRPWRFDHECKVAYTVLTPLDLNQESNLLQPVTNTKEKYLCCLCCQSGPITIVGKMSCTGFVPGQRAEVLVELDNNSGESVSVKCSLVKTVTFTATCAFRTKSRDVETVIVEEHLGQVGANGSNTWATSLAVPSLPASYLKHCNCINISYNIVMKASLGGMHKNTHVHIPVVIGTIPLRTYFSAIVPSAPMEPTAPGLDLPPSFEAAVGRGAVPPGGPPLSTPFHTYPDMPPPTYQECMLGRNNIRNKDDSEYMQGNMDFAPRYPLYQFK